MTSDAAPPSRPRPKKPATSVGEYLASFPESERVLLESALTAVREAIPGAVERISYGVVRLEREGSHPVYVGGWNNHIGIYPVPMAEGELERELAAYRTTKDSLHFRYDQPIPLDLIRRIAAYIVQ